MSPVEWSAVGIIVSTNLAGLGYLARQIARLDARVDRMEARIDARLDRLEERYIQHLEHHARFA